LAVKQTEVRRMASTCTWQ